MWRAASEFWREVHNWMHRTESLRQRGKLPTSTFHGFTNGAEFFFSNSAEQTEAPGGPSFS